MFLFIIIPHYCYAELIGLGSKVKSIATCSQCKNSFNISVGSKASICPDCLIAKKSVKQVADVVKKEAGYSKQIEFEITTPEQKLTAVRAQGEVFASKGGVDLMITEFVENSFDAIKRKKNLLALPKAIEQLNFDQTLAKLAFEKYNLTIFEFNEKYPNLSEENKKSFVTLHDKILDLVKSDFNKQETIVVEIDDKSEQVRIVDSGTGIEHPLHICKHPFRSLKTGEDHSQITGKFGRGSQVFREFCHLMQFYTLRDEIHRKEEQMIIDDKVDTTKINVKSILLTFPENYPGGIYGFIKTEEFKKLSNNNQTGTVVVLSNWKENYFKELSSHLTKLERRLQHHFGFGIGGIYNIGLKVKRGKNEIEITSKNYENEPKIQGLFDLKPISLSNAAGNSNGTVEFHIYKTSRSYDDEFKAPFLVVNGRPLGDTAIFEMPSLSSHSDVWKSSFVTGYVVCNSVEPNQMRIGLANTPTRQPFFDAMISASIELKKQNAAWKNEHAYAMDKEMVTEVITKVNKYLVKKGLKYNFKNPLQKGLQDDLQKSGDVNYEDRISNISGGDNQGIIDKNGEDVVQIGYEPSERGPPGPPGPDNHDDVIIVPNGSRKKDGDKIIMVKVKRSVVSKGGRKIRKSYSGPSLDFKADEDCGDELSYFEPQPPTIFIQSEHPAWQKLVKKSKDQTNAEKYKKEKFQYMLERYLWEIMNNEALQMDTEVTKEQKQNKFWSYFHELTDTK